MNCKEYFATVLYLVLKTYVIFFISDLQLGQWPVIVKGVTRLILNGTIQYMYKLYWGNTTCAYREEEIYKTTKQQNLTVYCTFKKIVEVSVVSIIDGMSPLNEQTGQSVNHWSDSQ